MIAIVLAPAVHASFENPRMERRIRIVGIATSLLPLSIAGLMVLRPGES